MLLMRSLIREEKVFMDHQPAKGSVSLSMIWICLKKKSMVLNLQLSLLDNGWTIKDGMIDHKKKNHSWKLKISSLFVQWDHQVEVKVYLHKGYKDTLISLHTQILVQNQSQWFLIRFLKHLLPVSQEQFLELLKILFNQHKLCTKV